jgi:TolA-binding protein
VEEPPANADEPREAVIERAPRSSVAPAPANSTGESRSWSARVAAGDFASVLGDADARGVDATLAKAPLSDLVALSDAARYKGRTDLARRALTSIRARFPASADARNALFHLGRLAEGRGALSDALASYDRYLSEARNGTFAAEAFGRKLVVTRKVAGDETARSVARDYLARFPGGSYAGTAKELLGSR